MSIPIGIFAKKIHPPRVRARDHCSCDRGRHRDHTLLVDSPPGLLRECGERFSHFTDGSASYRSAIQRHLGTPHTCPRPFPGSPCGSPPRPRSRMAQLGHLYGTHVAETGEAANQALGAFIDTYRRRPLADPPSSQRARSRYYCGECDERFSGGPPRDRRSAAAAHMNCAPGPSTRHRISAGLRDEAWGEADRGRGALGPWMWA